MRRDGGVGSTKSGVSMPNLPPVPARTAANQRERKRMQVQTLTTNDFVRDVVVVVAVVVFVVVVLNVFIRAAE